MSDVEVVRTRPVLQLGSQGPAVVAAQKLLNTHNTDPLLKIDGLFGPLTEAAVRAFQGSHGLEVDGKIGQYTWPALDAQPQPLRRAPQITPGAQMMVIAGRIEIEHLLADWYGSGMTRAQCGALLYDYMQQTEPWTQIPRSGLLALSLEILR